MNRLNTDDNFGLISFITGFKAKEKYRSVGFTKLLLISREDFLKIIKDFPNDFERFN